jgi:hypothetical protein
MSGDLRRRDILRQLFRLRTIRDLARAFLHGPGRRSTGWLAACELFGRLAGELRDLFANLLQWGGSQDHAAPLPHGVAGYRDLGPSATDIGHFLELTGGLLLFHRIRRLLQFFIEPLQLGFRPPHNLLLLLALLDGLFECGHQRIDVSLEQHKERLDLGSIDRSAGWHR